MLKMTINSQQFAYLLNLVRSAYLDECGRNGSYKLYSQLVDFADVAGFKQDSNRWWQPPTSDRLIAIALEDENGGK